jgi:hypothetical protein
MLARIRAGRLPPRATTARSALGHAAGELGAEATARAPRREALGMTRATLDVLVIAAAGVLLTLLIARFAL